jgi:hypothetical protein
MNNNIIFYKTPYRDLALMPVYAYEEKLHITPEKKVEMIDKIVKFLTKKNIHVNFSSYIYDPEVTKSWETESVFRDVPIAELKGNEIVINPRDIDFLSLFLSIAHIYGHLVQRSEPHKYIGITNFLTMLKPLSIEELMKEYKASFDTHLKHVSPKDYVGDYQKDFLRYEIEAFEYAWYTFEQAGIEVDEMLQYAMQVYLRTDYEELWGWASKSTKKEASSFMKRFAKNWNDTEQNNWKPYMLSGSKPIEIDVVPDPQGRLTVVRNGYTIENIYLN